DRAFADRPASSAVTGPMATEAPGAVMAATTGQYPSPAAGEVVPANVAPSVEPPVGAPPAPHVPQNVPTPYGRQAMRPPQPRQPFKPRGSVPMLLEGRLAPTSESSPARSSGTSTGLIPMLYKGSASRPVTSAPVRTAQLSPTEQEAAPVAPAA